MPCSVGRVIFHADYIPSGRKALTLADLDGEVQAEQENRELEEALELMEGERDEYKERVEMLEARMRRKNVMLGCFHKYHTRVLRAVDEEAEGSQTSDEAIELIEALSKTMVEDLADYEEAMADLVRPQQ